MLFAIFQFNVNTLLFQAMVMKVPLVALNLAQFNQLTIGHILPARELQEQISLGLEVQV